MKTRIIKINSNNPQQSTIAKCTTILKNGGIVAFPTETVYGLGADGLNPKAIKKIFKVKNRPFDNPLIFHIANKQDIEILAKHIPEITQKLIKKFWPGPLTLILKKSKTIPQIATGKQDTVALRMPSNKIALSLIKSLGHPIVAPSANLFGKPSPTMAKHVFDDLNGKIDIIIDGGQTRIGIESTVLDLTSKIPTILRPGGISLSELKKILKNVEYHPILLGKKSRIAPKSPGMKYKHYSPNAKVILVKGSTKNSQQKIESLIQKLLLENKSIGLINYKSIQKNPLIISKFIGYEKDLIAKNIYKIFREFDKENADIIIVREINNSNLGFAIMNRLQKAASEII